MMNDDQPTEITKKGNRIWRNAAGYNHREGGPAIEFANGSKMWSRNGLLHREDGPAYERSDGDKFWYRNGRLHRENVPAVELADGGLEYWINGERVEPPKESNQPKPR